MMRVCHICPPKLAHHMMQVGTVNQLILGQEARQLNAARPLRDHAPKGTEPYILTDSGSWELGLPVDIAPLHEFTVYHKADAMILPDVGADSKATWEYTRRSVHYLRSLGPFHYELVGCAQGMSFDELREDLKVFADLGIRQVGVPSKLFRDQWRSWGGPGRPTVLHELAPDLRSLGMKVHLLGLMERPTELLEIASDPTLTDLVVSVDTATALRWAFFEQFPQWWPMLQVPRWIWENLEFRDLSSEVWHRWTLNRTLLESWAQGKL